MLYTRPAPWAAAFSRVTRVLSSFLRLTGDSTEHCAATRGQVIVSNEIGGFLWPKIDDDGKECEAGLPCPDPTIQLKAKLKIP